MCNKFVDCYFCPPAKLEACSQVLAAFGPAPTRRKNAKDNIKLCTNPNCGQPRQAHSRFCAECRGVADRRRYAMRPKRR